MLVNYFLFKVLGFGNSTVIWILAQNVPYLCLCMQALILFLWLHAARVVTADRHAHVNMLMQISLTFVYFPAAVEVAVTIIISYLLCKEVPRAFFSDD